MRDTSNFGPLPGNVFKEPGYFSTLLISPKRAGDVKSSQPLTTVFQGVHYELYWAWPAEKNNGQDSLYNVTHYRDCQAGGCVSGVWLNTSGPVAVKTGIGQDEAIAYLKTMEEFAIEAGYDLTENHLRPGMHHSQAVLSQKQAARTNDGPAPKFF